MQAVDVELGLHRFREASGRRPNLYGLVRTRPQYIANCRAEGYDDGDGAWS
jgi:hypothetical protein